MRRVTIRSFLVAGVWLIPSLSLAQENSCASLLATRGVLPGPLYYLGANGLGTTKWYWLQPGQKLRVGNGTPSVQFASIVPGHAGSKGTGMMLVKITHVNSSAQNASARIRVVRPAFETDCKGRYLTDYFYVFSSQLNRPEVSSDVDIADYIYYHKTRSDIGQETLYGFHVDYRDYRGFCIKTDDKRNGNRQQFLFEDDRRQDNSLVLANIRENVTAVARPLGAEQYVNKLFPRKSGRSLHDLVAAYLKNSRIETHLYPYDLASSRCISFVIDSIYPEDVVTIRLNDLEQRDKNGNLLPALARHERTFFLESRP
jgi:hypothetical protein